MQRTLYISDLDGTLLHSNRRLTADTIAVLNCLIENGVCFSYATARSLHTARKVTQGLCAAFPAVIYNGTMIKDHRTGKVLWQHGFSKDESIALLEALTREGVSPIVYSFHPDGERFSFLPSRQTEAAAAFLAHSTTDERYHPISDASHLLDGDVFYFTCIGDRERLTRAYASVKPLARCLFQDDPYTGEPWLECMPGGASKANAALQLKTMLGATRLVAFGDGLNDLDLFRVADEAYAVENAEDALKTEATAVIGHHDTDSVARWIEADVQKRSENE